MPQNEYINHHRKKYGQRFDFESKNTKREIRKIRKRADYARKSLGIKGKICAMKHRSEKAQMERITTIHHKTEDRLKVDDGTPKNSVPAYLLERGHTNSVKLMSESIKLKRKEKAGKWELPLPKVRSIKEEEIFKA